jgi:hypothetical protein
MKSLFVMLMSGLLLSGLVFAQTVKTTANTTIATSGSVIVNSTYPWSSQYDAKHTILMVWTTWEKCYECNFSYAMVCSPGVDCNTPSKSVEHYGWFETAADAIKAANERQFEVVSLSKAIPLKFDKATVHEQIPQPPQDKEVKVYTTTKE